MHGGREVKNLGHGFMVAFASTTDAVASAIAIQQAVEQANRTAPIRTSVRVGLHVGEPVLDNGDYFGAPVAVAKRLCNAAQPTRSSPPTSSKPFRPAKRTSSTGVN